jgi:hypothetical protein
LPTDLAFKRKLGCARHAPEIWDQAIFSLKRGSTLKNITDELKNQPEEQVAL